MRTQQYDSLQGCLIVAFKTDHYELGSALAARNLQLNRIALPYREILKRALSLASEKPMGENGKRV
jgi:hypothetical protein